jgi:hypothetical protein
MTLPLAAIVISGLALAWTIVWSIYSHRRTSRPSISARAAWTYPVYDLPSGGSQLGDATVGITATNNGPMPVTISTAKFLIRGIGKGTSVVPMEWVAQTPRDLPVRLQPGDHWTGLAHADSVKASIDRHLGPRRRWRVRPVVADTADRTYRAVIYRRGWRRFTPGARRWLELEHEGA